MVWTRMLPACWNKLPSRTPSLTSNHHRRLRACAIERHRAPPNLVCTKPPHSVLRRVRTQNLVVLAPPIRNRIADARSSPNLMHACAVPSPAAIVSPAPSAAPTVLWVSGHASCAASPCARRIPVAPSAHTGQLSGRTHPPNRSRAIHIASWPRPLIFFPIIHLPRLQQPGSWLPLPPCPSSSPACT